MTLFIVTAILILAGFIGAYLVYLKEKKVQDKSYIDITSMSEISKEEFSKTTEEYPHKVEMEYSHYASYHKFIEALKFYRIKVKPLGAFSEYNEGELYARSLVLLLERNKEKFVIKMNTRTRTAPESAFVDYNMEEHGLLFFDRIDLLTKMESTSIKTAFIDNCVKDAKMERIIEDNDSMETIETYFPIFREGNVHFVAREMPIDAKKINNIFYPSFKFKYNGRSIELGVKEAQEVIAMSLQDGKNICVYGDAGTGKTVLCTSTLVALSKTNPVLVLDATSFLAILNNPQAVGQITSQFGGRKEKLIIYVDEYDGVLANLFENDEKTEKLSAILSSLDGPINAGWNAAFLCTSNKDIYGYPEVLHRRFQSLLTMPKLNKMEAVRVASFIMNNIEEGKFFDDKSFQELVSRQDSISLSDVFKFLASKAIEDKINKFISKLIAERSASAKKESKTEDSVENMVKDFTTKNGKKKHK